MKDVSSLERKRFFASLRMTTAVLVILSDAKNLCVLAPPAECSGPFASLRMAILKIFHCRLHPRAHQVAYSSTYEQAVSAVFEIALIDLCALQELGVAEAEAL